MKLLKREDVITLINILKKNGRKIVFTNGCFDILHIGHLRYLEKAKKHGDILVVGVNSDDSVKRLKGLTRPINSEKDRAELLCGLKAVDYTIIFEEDTPVEIIEIVQPSIHVKGGDYKKEDLPETVVVEKYGGKIIIVDLVKGKSTTNIINEINIK